MFILGIDPGIALTGWGVIEKDESSRNGLKMVEYGVIQTLKGDDHNERLLELHDDLASVIEEFSPEYIAIEQLFFCKNLKTAITVGEARGVILLTVTEAGIPVREFTPLQIKDAVCGYGKAPKRQVQEMVKSILGLDEIPEPDDAADGLAVAICCASSLGMEQAINSSDM
jgi:crossover junction endodeoxyribonuclease RuvC